jgi:hypothetical protein
LLPPNPFHHTFILLYLPPAIDIVSAPKSGQDEEQGLRARRASWLLESEMRSDHYFHPEFGLLSPTPRLRRELRVVFFSAVFGIAIGAAAVIALSGNKTSDDAQVSGVTSASIIKRQTD